MAAIGSWEYILMAGSLVWTGVGTGLVVVLVGCAWRAMKALEGIAAALERTCAPPASRG